ncbi:zinc finger protein ush isoform X2 [Rhynchophorus ferrugineus]|uniref:zinc finger protein ush isoform X2 n=2 Tax=Rhynchophorus ferrugineus TaxID=354439 RepID=UPI003FCD3AAB
MTDYIKTTNYHVHNPDFITRKGQKRMESMALCHELWKIKYDFKRKRDEARDWTERPAEGSPPDSNQQSGTGRNMVTVLEAPPKKSDSPDRPASDDDRKSPTKTEPEEKQPRIRLKAGLATDPALNMFSSIKTEAEPPNPTPEYLSSLAPAIQSALASRGLLFPAGLNLSEAVAAVAAAQMAVSGEVARAPSAEIVASPETSRPSVPVYQCSPCGIRFSSLSTLEAHQTYYCSHRPNKPSEDDPKATSSDPSSQSEADGTDSTSKTLRTTKQYTCPHCSYSADKKVSLNRHMRMHTASPGPTNTPTPAPNSTSVPNGETSGAEGQDRYCAECDIRFSTQKTYRAHKAHYCNSRHVVKQAAPASSCTSGSSPTSPVDPSACRTPPSPTSQLPQQPFLALPTNPIIIVPYSLFRSASVLPSLSTATGIPNPDTPCFLLPNGTLQPMTSALSAMTTAAASNPNTPAQPTPDQVLKAINKTNKEEPPASKENPSSAPLDLTVRKSPELKEKDRNSTPKSNDMDLDHEKENLKHPPFSPEKIECEPLIHHSPCSTPGMAIEKSSPGLRQPISISPKRNLDDLSRSNSPRSSKTPKLSNEKTSLETAVPTGSQFDIPSLHPLLMRAGNMPLFSPELQMRLSDLTPLPPVMPQVIVKQGVSKCKECNIVFCKHENYVIHKKHYCSARNLEDDSSKTSGSPPVSPSAGATSPAAQYQQLICLACGIKFTSPDNLNAHQQYYCLKRNDLEPKKCLKCRAVVEPGHQCISHTALAGWKCPCCDVISATASAAQRHMETHTGVKAYRCTICKYKGNTLRGMKTHIRVHFDKRSPDLQEEKYISYILEGDNIAAGIAEVPLASHISIDERASPNPERPDPQHSCPQCPYASPYKANVVRHIKLVHEANNDDHLSNGEEKGASGSAKNMQIDEEEEIIVKKEAMEPEVIIAPVEGATIKEEPELSTTPNSKTSDDEIMQEASKNGPNYCQSCDIYFNYLKTFIAHKKFYCSSHTGEISNSNNNNNTGTRTAETSVL